MIALTEDTVRAMVSHLEDIRENYRVQRPPTVYQASAATTVISILTAKLSPAAPQEKS